jgi:predicted ATPase
LTLLSGVNGAGKSSVIQALLVLRQIYLRGSFLDRQVSLSGDLVDLGGASDILYSSADEDIIRLKIEADPFHKLVTEFSVDSEGGQANWENLVEAYDTIKAMAEAGFPIFNGGPFDNSTVADFNYLNAERYGPRKALPVDDQHGRLFDLGKHGEYVFDALLHHQDSITLAPSDARYLEAASGGRLRDQIEAWLDEISPGVQLSIAGVPRADMAVGSFTFGREGALRSPEYRATNVGFGLSYILPVLAALLAAPVDGLVLIENPEAHLHPRGQTKMGELCARAAAAGVQVIIETHSDHVLDGARLAVRDRIVNKEDVSFHYLQQIDGKAVRTTPIIDDEGRLSEWPEGFFDQHRRNAARLTRPRR